MGQLEIGVEILHSTRERGELLMHLMGGRGGGGMLCEKLCITSLNQSAHLRQVHLGPESRAVAEELGPNWRGLFSNGLMEESGPQRRSPLCAGRAVLALAAQRCLLPFTEPVDLSWN